MKSKVFIGIAPLLDPRDMKEAGNVPLEHDRCHHVGSPRTYRGEARRGSRPVLADVHNRCATSLDYIMLDERVGQC